MTRLLRAAAGLLLCVGGVGGAASFAQTVIFDGTSYSGGYYPGLLPTVTGSPQYDTGLTGYQMTQYITVTPRATITIQSADTGVSGHGLGIYNFGGAFVGSIPFPYTAGQTFVVPDGGSIIYFGGTAVSMGTQKLTMSVPTLSAGLFSRGTVTNDTLLRTDGTMTSGVAGYYTSAEIGVTPGQVLSTNVGEHIGNPPGEGFALIAFYDSSHAALASSTAHDGCCDTGSITITVPVGAAYARLGGQMTSIPVQGLAVAPATTASLVVTLGSPTAATGGSSTFTGTLSVSGSGATPTGTVQFKYDGSSVGPAVTLTSGHASYTYGSLGGVGAHTVSAVYSGDGTFPSATASGVTLTVAGGLLTITHTGITDVGGNVLAHGRECFTPVNNAGVPIAANYPGGTITKTPKCWTVTNGVLDSAARLVNSSLTSPLNLCYQLTLTDSTTGATVIGPRDGYGCIQPTSNIDINTITPNLPGLVVQVPGVKGR